MGIDGQEKVLSVPDRASVLISFPRHLKLTADDEIDLARGQFLLRCRIFTVTGFQKQFLCFLSGTGFGNAAKLGRR